MDLVREGHLRGTRPGPFQRRVGRAYRRREHARRRRAAVVVALVGLDDRGAAVGERVHEVAREHRRSRDRGRSGPDLAGTDRSRRGDPEHEVVGGFERPRAIAVLEERDRKGTRRRSRPGVSDLGHHRSGHLQRRWVHDQPAGVDALDHEVGKDARRSDHDPHLVVRGQLSVAGRQSQAIGAELGEGGRGGRLSGRAERDRCGARQLGPPVRERAVGPAVVLNPAGQGRRSVGENDRLVDTGIDLRCGVGRIHRDGDLVGHRRGPVAGGQEKDVITKGRPPGDRRRGLERPRERDRPRPAQQRPLDRE